MPSSIHGACGATCQAGDQVLVRRVGESGTQKITSKLGETTASEPRETIYCIGGVRALYRRCNVPLRSSCIGAAHAQDSIFYSFSRLVHIYFVSPIYIPSPSPSVEILQRVLPFDHLGHAHFVDYDHGRIVTAGGSS